MPLHGLTRQFAHRVELREVGFDVEPRIFDPRDEQRRRGEIVPAACTAVVNACARSLCTEIPVVSGFAGPGWSSAFTGRRQADRASAGSTSCRPSTTSSAACSFAAG